MTASFPKKEGLSQLKYLNTMTVSRQEGERSSICIRSIDFASGSTYLQFAFGIVLTIWFGFVCFLLFVCFLFVFCFLFLFLFLFLFFFVFFICFLLLPCSVASYICGYSTGLTGAHSPGSLEVHATSNKVYYLPPSLIPMFISYKINNQLNFICMQ